MFRFRLALAACFLAVTLRASAPEFEQNTGQAESQYLFLARAGAARAYIEDRGLELATTSGAPVRLTWAERLAGIRGSAGDWKIFEATGNVTHYCLQGKPSLCTEGVKSYRRLLRKNLYPGIDWELHGRGGQLEYDLVVHPGAKVGEARLRVEGAPAEVGADGRLRAGAMLHWRPMAYQVIRDKRVEVSAELRATGDAEFEFVVGEYDAGHDLVIDPVVEGISVAGGDDEDTIQGFLRESSGGCSFSYGTTRSADWHQLPATGGRHVFVQIGNSALGSKTIFWGGEGEEFIGGIDSALSNCQLYLVGWTNSRNAPVLSGMYENLTTHPYAGGATDGFFLKFSRDGLIFASYLGGPGGDRVYDVRATSINGDLGAFAFAGETDDTGWAGATVRKIGAGGKTDAIAGVLLETRISLLAIGGAGDDRMMRLRRDGDGFWAMAGETDSPDFPMREGGSDSVKAAAGKDLWIGRARRDLSELSVLLLFGGSGDERFGGLGVLEQQGLYLAGTTNSRDLPAAGTPYHGGDSDGFVAFLSPLTAIPQAVTYIGGSARDEISTADARDGDVFLGGMTDSDDLTLPGLAAGEGIHGALDGLFVLCDAFGTPSRGVRLGGAADDRVLGITPFALGKVIVTGSSNSREWLNELDSLHITSSGQDGYAATVTFPGVRIDGFSSGTPGRVYLGRDLQVPMTVLTASEAGMDGILIVRSSDPSRLLVSPSSDLPGTEQILLEETDQNTSYSSGRTFVLQALADSGEVEVIVEGRATASSKGAYQSRRILVSLVPSALFLLSPKDVSVAVNSTADIAFTHAPLMADGRSGPSESPRAGVTSTPGLISSDATGLQVLRDSLRQTGPAGTFRIQALALRAGSYTLTPSSTQFPAGPEQSLTVRVGNSPAASKFFPDQPLILAKDNFTSFSIRGFAGDQLQFTSEDAARVALGGDSYASAGTLSVKLQAGNPYGTLVIAAMSGEGIVRVRVDGTYQGRPISESLLVYLVPYKAVFTALPESVGSGVQRYVEARLLPQTAMTDAINPVIPTMTPRPGAFTNVQLRSSNPSVLQVTPTQNAVLNFLMVAGEPGNAVLDFGPDAPEEFAELRALVQVVTPRINFGTEVFRVPAGTSLLIYAAVGARANPSALKAVRLRLSENAPLTLERWGQPGTDLTLDFSGGYGVVLAAANARAGQQADLYISAPGVPEYSVPIRVVEAVLLPFTTEMQVTPLNGSPAAGDASYSLGGYDEGLVSRPESGRLIPSKTFKLRPRMNPAGICETSETGELSGPGGLTLHFTCSGAGVTVLTLEPVDGLSAAQAQFPVRIVSMPSRSAPVQISTRVLTGNGLQARLSLYDAGAPFSGTITSNDPDRVRLSLDAKAPGSRMISVPVRTYTDAVYVQGFASQGSATLTVETTDGRKADIVVYLLAPTLAVRPHTPGYGPDPLPVRSLDHPLSSMDLAVDLRPGLVDPDTGKLIWSSGLSIRGGTDPAFVGAKSSDSSVVEPAAPDALVSEADTAGRLNFRVKTTGEAMLSAMQPEGFTEVPESSLRVRVFERRLAFATSPLLSAELQMPVSLVATAGDTQSNSNATITSLDPEKLLISSDGSTAGATSITAPLGKPVYLQALSTATPGETARVLLEAPGYATTEQQVEFLAAELQMMYPESALALRPLVNSSLNLRYGPVDRFGQISSLFSGSFRPGVRLPVRISTSDSGIVGTSNSNMTLETFMNVTLLPVAPGRAQIRIDTPPQITNRVANLDTVVGLFEFPPVSLGAPVRYLVTRFSVTNPRTQPTSITVSSGEGAPLRFGTAAIGPDAPAASTLLVTLAGKESRSLYMEPAGPGSSASVRLEAQDFQPASSGTHLNDPQARFDPSTPLIVSLANRTAQVSITLTDPNRNPVELPLGTSFGPLKIQLESSNSQVVRVTTAILEFVPGDSRKSVGLELAGRGDAVVSLTVPAAFAGAPSVRQDLVVSVR